MNEIFTWLLLTAVMMVALVGAFIVFKKNRVFRRPYQTQGTPRKKGKTPHYLEGEDKEETVRDACCDERTLADTYDDEKTIGELYPDEKTHGTGNCDEKTVDKPFNYVKTLKTQDAGDQSDEVTSETSDDQWATKSAPEKAWLDSTMGVYQHPEVRHSKHVSQQQTTQNLKDKSSDIQNTENAIPNTNLENTVVPIHWKPKTIIETEIDTKGKTLTKKLYFSDNMTIGRAEDCDLHLPFDYVSRKHLLFAKKGGELTVENLTSNKTGNYTLLNGEPIVQGTVLKDDDVIEIADTMIKIHIIRI